MASNLRLDFVGTQARNFGGQYLGLPVIGVPGHKSRSMPNLLPPTALNPESPQAPMHRNSRMSDNNVGTQVHIQDLQNNSKMIPEEVTVDGDSNDDSTLVIKMSVNTDLIPDVNAQSQSLSRSNSNKIVLHKTTGKLQIQTPSAPLILHSMIESQGENEERLFVLDDSDYEPRSPPAIYDNMQQTFTPERLSSEQRNQKREHLKRTQMRRIRSNHDMNLHPKKQVTLDGGVTSLHNTIGTGQNATGGEGSTQKSLSEAGRQSSAYSFKVKRPKNFHFKILPVDRRQANTVQKPPLPQRPRVTIQAFESTKGLQFLHKEKPKTITFNKSSSQKEIQTKKLELSKIQDLYLMRIKVPSTLPQFHYEVETRDQYIAKYLRSGRFDLIKTNNQEARGLVSLKKGDYQKAEQLLTGRNLCIYLIEVQKFEEAFAIANKLEQLDILKYLAELNVLTSFDQKRTSKLTLQCVPQFDSKQTSSSQTIIQIKDLSCSPTVTVHQEAPIITELLPQIQRSKSKDSKKSFDLEFPMTSESLDLKFGKSVVSDNKNMTNYTAFQNPQNRKTLENFAISDAQIIEERPRSNISHRGPNKDQVPKLPKLVKYETLQPPKPSQRAHGRQSIHNSPGDEKGQDQDKKLLQTPSQKSFISNKPKQVSDFQTDKLLSSLVCQSIANIERFKFVIGGQENMDKYIMKYANEWRSGQIQQMNKNKRERPWSSHKKQEETAYELSHSKFSAFKGTINLLVENYLIQRDKPKSIASSRFHKQIQPVHDDTSDSRVSHLTSSPNIHEIATSSNHNQMNGTGMTHFINMRMRESSKLIDPTGRQFSNNNSQSPVNTTFSKYPLHSGMQTKTSHMFKRSTHVPLVIREMQEIVQDFEVPEHLQARFEQLEATLKVGVVTPRIGELMISEMDNQQIHECTKAVGHLEKLLNNSQLSNADSEHIEDNFWSKVQVTYKNREQPADIFYMDENENKELYAGLASIVEGINEKPAQSQAAHGSAGGSNRTQNHHFFVEHFMKLINQNISQTDPKEVEHVSWLQSLFEDVSVSDTIQGLLKNRTQQLTENDGKDMDCLGSGNQPLGSILLLIREEFAKIKLHPSTERQSHMSEGNHLSQSHITQTVAAVKQTSYRQGRYKLLSQMLSKISYFSHFDGMTRQKLIEISKHSIYRAGTTLMHSEELGDKILVVISGAVSVFIKDKHRPDDFERVRHTLYPGDSIGDAPLRLILTSDNMHFFLRAAVDSDVLLIKKNDIPEILKSEILDLLNHKIMPLQSCTLFAGEDHQSPYTIFVLANLVTIKEYQYGEVIQKQGTQADDSMYLVVRGYCRAVFESTLAKLEIKSTTPRFCNSKEIYGELGVIQGHINSINPEFVVKNVKQQLRPALVKMRLGYLPRVQLKKPRKIQILTQKQIKLFDEPHSEHQNHSSDENLNESQQTSTGASHPEDQSDSPSHTPHNHTSNRNFDDDQSSIEEAQTNRTQRKNDQEALVGHRNPKIVETTFEKHEKKDRIIENQPLPVSPPVQDITQLKKHLPHLDFTEDTAKFMQMKGDAKLSAHIDVVQHQKSIGVGQIFCSRALLDETRSIKNIQSEWNDFMQASAPQGKEKSLNATVENFYVSDKLQRQMKINDSKLPAEIRNKDKREKSPNQVSDEPNTEQTATTEPKDPIWKKIFNNLRQLLGDAEVKKKSPAQLFRYLNQSQLTIVADSSDLVLLCIKQHDLSQLSEPVRRRIEREIKNQLFVDIDRPFTTKEQQDTFVNEYRDWYKKRQQVSDQVQEDKRLRR